MTIFHPTYSINKIYRLLASIGGRGGGGKWQTITCDSPTKLRTRVSTEVVL
jgi:hypothetical protein